MACAAAELAFCWIGVEGAVVFCSLGKVETSANDRRRAAQFPDSTAVALDGMELVGYSLSELRRLFIRTKKKCTTDGIIHVDLLTIFFYIKPLNYFNYLANTKLAEY